MTSLHDVLQRWKENPNRIRLADESQCRACGYFDIGYPGVEEALAAADPTGKRNLLTMARCKCGARERQEADEAERLASLANLPRGRIGHRTLETFKERPGTAGMRTAVMDFLRSRSPKGLTISGPTGSGKTHMLEAIGRKWLERQRTVRYEVAAGLVDRLRRQSYSGEMDLWDWWNWYESRDLLLLDDLGLERSTPYAAEHLTRLVDDRLRKELPLVVATNLAQDEMAEHLGDRVASRLYVDREDVDGLQLVTTSASDYRQALDEG